MHQPDPDTLLDERYERIDSGRECPVCWKQIEPFWYFNARGEQMWNCFYCEANWIKKAKK